jgi:hypothetical protein
LQRASGHMVQPRSQVQPRSHSMVEPRSHSGMGAPTSVEKALEARRTHSLENALEARANELQAHSSTT